jgi:hypothetical protein
MKMAIDGNQLATFGDVRRSILETIQALKAGDMDVSRGMAIAANFKVLNDSVQVEINAAKMALATEGKAHSFGRIVGMGRRLIANDASQESA